MSNGNDLSPNRVSPVVDFTSADFDSIDQDLTTYAQAEHADRWTDFNDTQFAVVMKQLTAYVGDLCVYHINASLRETFAATAIRRESLTNLGKPFGIAPEEPSSAATTLDVTLDPGGTYPFTLTKEDNLFSNGNSDDEVFYHPTNEVVVSAYDANYTLECTEGEFFKDELIGVSDGTVGQRWQFPQVGALKDGLILNVGAATWSVVTNFTNYTSADRVYKLVSNDSDELFAIFGDGVYGAIPPRGAEIRATFRNGGGSRGKVAKDTIDTVVASHVNIQAVNNPAASSGGSPEQTLREARDAFAGSLETLERGVTSADYATLAEDVSGVSKALGRAGRPAGSRFIEVVVAPSGGGAPSDALKNSVLTALESAKMVTNRLRATSAVYRDIRMEVLLHVNSSFRAAAVEQLSRNSLINQNNTGLLDFNQLDFRGVDKGGQLLVASTPIQDHFATLKQSGLDRAEILRLDVVPTVRERDGGNTGNGTVEDSSIITNSRQRRRQFFIELQSASQYAVYERIVGCISELSDLTLIDETKVFEDEVDDYTGYLLIPDLQADFNVGVASATSQTVTISGSQSLFTMTSTGSEYALFDPTPTLVNVGSQFTSADGSVKFTLTAGTTAFINGDSFTLDVFPHIGDIQLRADEFPQLLDANLITRTSGGT